MVFPALLAFVWEDPGAQSAVDIAVASLPIAGDASVPNGTGGAPVSAFGAQSNNVPVSTASSLYSRSAQVATVHPGMWTDTPAKEGKVVDYNVLVFNALHPATLAAEDLLATGAELQRMPATADLATIVYREFCMGGLNAPEGSLQAGKLGANNNMAKSLLSYMPLAEIARACPGLR